MKKVKLPHDLRVWLRSKGCAEDADGNWYPPAHLPQKKLSLLGLLASFWFGRAFTIGFAVISNVALAWALNYFFGVPWPWTVAVLTVLIMFGIWRSEQQQKSVENLTAQSASGHTSSREELMALWSKLEDPGFRPFGGDLPASPDFIQSTKNWIRAEINRMDMAHEDMSSREATHEGFRYATRTGQGDRFIEALKRIENHAKLHRDDPKPIQEDLAFIAEVVARARLERPLACETAAAEVGWYFMLPPLVPRSLPVEENTRLCADTNAPLSKWAKLGPFDSREECYQAADRFRQEIRQGEGPEKDNREADETLQYWFEKAECIRADDPRLIAESERS